MNLADYPKDWKNFSVRIRVDRAAGQCECAGECGLHGASLFKPGPRRCVERHGHPAQWAKGKIVLTVAHLNAPGGPCQCEPRCGIDAHVKAMCQRCHLRYDIDRHVMHRTEKRDAERLRKRTV